MVMKFPLILTIDDILPHIEGRDEFVVAHKQDYTAIDYNYVLPDTFDNPYRLECRGIKFDAFGEILARPYHKFFNLGEKNTTFDIHQKHYVAEKLDGSMIHPAIVNNKLLLMTRMGHTDVAKQAQQWAEQNNTRLLEYSEKLLIGGITPIFEWTSPQNRIVIAYPKSALYLTGARFTVSGEYLDFCELRHIAQWCDVSLASQRPSPNTVEELAESIRGLKDEEGVVVCCDDGHRVKIKAEDYVLKHKIMAEVAQERHFARAVLEGKSDDIMALMSKDVALSYEKYQQALHTSMQLQAHEIQASVDWADYKEWTHKHFAEQVENYHNGIPQWLKAAYYTARRKGVPAYDALTGVLSSHAVNNRKWKVIKDAWKLPDLQYNPAVGEDQ
jgi:RNA ligase